MTSRALRVFTFPGQSSVPKIESIGPIIEKYRPTFDQFKYYPELLKTLKTPQTISSLSYLYFSIYAQRPDFFLGHSLGELTCLAANNVISPSSLYEIARKRDELMRSALPKDIDYSMYAVICKPDKFDSVYKQLLDKNLDISNVNSDRQITITGKTSLLSEIKLEGAKTMKIPGIDVPFHNPVLQSIEGPLYDLIMEHRQISLHEKLGVRILSNVDAKAADTVDQAIEKFVLATSRPVLFKQAVEYFAELGVSAVNFGPGSVCHGLTKSKLSSTSVDSAEDLQEANKI